MWISKLSIKPTDQWLHIFRSGELWEKYNEGIVGTREEIIDALLELSDSDKFLEKFQEKQSAKEKAPYEKFKPLWFDDAPESAKAKWEEYKNTNNLQKLQWIHDNVSYNPDSTMNIIKLNKTFCEDISWQDKRFTWEQAKELEKTNAGWYKLMTDYNNCDADKKEKTDWYKVINIFSNGNGDIVEGRELFRDMAWCNDRYWTATVYKDENWVENNDLALTRYLFLKDLYKHWSYTSNDFRLCGLKDSMNVV